MESRQKPTHKQKEAVKKVLEGTPISTAMKEVGYALSTAKTTTKLTSSKAWQDLMEEHLPDSLLTEKHLALLNKEEKVVRNNVTSGEIEVIPTGEVDTASVAKGLDMAYKLKRKYPTETEGGNKTLILNIVNEVADRYELNTTPKPEDSSEG